MNFFKHQKYNYLVLLMIVLALFSTYTPLSSRYIFENVHTVKEDLSVQFNSGLLIGFRNDLDKTTTYRTLWIAPDKDNNLKVLKELNYILVPHRDNFWQIEPLRYSFTNTGDWIEYPVAHAVGDSYTPETFEYKYNTYNCKLNFVDRNHVSISTYTKYHPTKEKSYAREDCAVVELEKLTHYRNTEDKLTMVDVFKENALSTINKISKTKITLGESADTHNINTTTGDSWTISRVDGKWIPQIAKTFKYASKNSNYTLYNTTLQLPQSIVSYNDLCTDFNLIKEIIPDAKDAISSPDKDILGVFTDNKLTLYAYSKGTIGKAALEIQLNENETMIMNQWTSGNSVEQWTDAFNKSLPVID
ncbi:hypothetical protein N4T77_08575 [Clostridium sp. CX1]|uniref:MucBP domain-containing protein n=1 Tax=Clostridium tanneri TaxID=3037988 RepID=A0ABU4JVB1_9CLOT|nr:MULTISPECIES: hypothetical protein [unclassified Clostridium]MCT8976650.1 hypothetical protein [Clostridium sp. CX1]MDW8801863.1 hypothetical protein [Clostridium sp. A1-XYC3]